MNELTTIAMQIPDETNFQPFWGALFEVVGPAAVLLRNEGRLFQPGAEELELLSRNIGFCISTAIGHSVHAGICVPALVSCSRRLQQQIEIIRESDYDLSVEYQELNDLMYGLIHLLDSHCRGTDFVYRAVVLKWC